MENKTITWILRRFDAALYLTMAQRVPLTILMIALGSAVASLFCGIRWAVFSIAMSAVAFGLIAGAVGLWASAIGNAAQKISQAYERETTRGAATPQSPAATLPGRIN